MNGNSNSANVSSFRIHSNGGGKVCQRSIVDKETYLAPDVTVINSEIRGTSYLKGQYLVEDSYINELTILPNIHGGAILGIIKKSHVKNCSIRGSIVLDSCFTLGATYQSIKKPIRIKYFYITHSFIFGNFVLIGKPTKPLPFPDGRYPKIIRSHMEGEMTIKLPHTTEIHSTIIKPNNSPRQVHPNKRVLSELLASIPEHE